MSLVYCKPWPASNTEQAIRSPQFFINSKARLGGTTTDFFWQPDTGLTANMDGNQLKMGQVTLPHTFYNIVSLATVGNGNVDGLYPGLVWCTNANSQTPTWYAVAVAPGNYTASQLIALFTTTTTSAQDSNIQTFAITIDTNTQKCTMVFTYVAATTVTLLRTQVTDLLGFTNHTSAWSVQSTNSTTATLVASNIVDMLPMKKVYVAVDLPRHSNSAFAVLGETARVVTPLIWTNIGNYFNVAARGCTQPTKMRACMCAVPLPVATYGQVIVYQLNTEDMPMSAEDVGSGAFRIRLLDEWGEVAENNGVEWSLTLHMDLQKPSHK